MQKRNKKPEQMKKTLLTILTMAACAVSGRAQTLEACQRAAEQNYPLIKEYGLIEQTRALTIANIQKSWLPQITASAQATYQSDVTSWPDEMQGLMQQMGVNMKGLSKDQYRVGVDVNQTVYDGGAISGRKRVAEAQSAVEAVQNEVTLYSIKERVNEMYFGLLLLNENIQLLNNVEKLLASSEKQLESMSRHGVAAESDYLLIKAERLKTVQDLTTLQSQKQALTKMLSTFCGIEVKEPVKPSAEVALTGNNRPELRLIDAQMQLVNEREKLTDSELLPRVSLFAQGFYGYPGLNMFKDMIDRKWSLNGLVGVKMSWNIGSFYTRKNDKAKLQLERQSLENRRETFLFNNNLKQIKLNDEIALYRTLMSQDEDIIALRQSVRKAAESRLAHGIIDVNDLVKEINNEHAARIAQSTHEIEMLKRIYDLKITTNN